MALSYWVHLTLVSGNAKTGPIPVSTTEAATCAVGCPFATDAEGGCYAASGPLALHWAAVSRRERGMSWDAFCVAIASLDEGTLWRHDQAGDLPGDGWTIDEEALGALVTANSGKRGFTYTHYDPMHASNAAVVEMANLSGFTVNLSANSIEHADVLAGLDIAPVVCVLPVDYQRAHKAGTFTETADAYRARMATLPQATPQGRRFVVCPATSRDDVSCATCQLCQRQRDVIVGFPAHGSGAKRADAVARRVIPIVATPSF